MIISLIVAVSQNQVIGKNNQLLWHLPKDLQFFKQKTQGHCILMGRKTFESIGRVLPQRTNIVLSQQKWQHEGLHIVQNWENALQIAQQKHETEFFVVGGSQIYALALPYVQRIYLTWVKADLEGDVFFPKLDIFWKEVSRLSNKADQKHAYDFDFVTYERI